MYRFIFPVSLFVSACLLFIIQPMVAKVLLPVYGGTPAVWTVCMLFFQLLLLLAYSYAWVLSRFSKWRVVHLCVCLLSLCVMPMSFVPQASEGTPEIQILLGLLLQLGLPLLVVGASAPLLQFAYSQTKGKRAADPYFLYVASNTGSLLALLSYPWLVERFSGVTQQFYGWNSIYFIYLGLLSYLLFAVRYQKVSPTEEKSLVIPWQQRALWIGLSFIPCSLMLGVTFYISTDIAATPLFWVLPLALYLLSFILTFASKPLIPHAWVARYILLFLALPILGFIYGANQVPVVPLIIANLIGFFMLSLLCLGELVRIRPPAAQLTMFYFYLSLGGVFAGIFNGLLAPRIFSHAYEYPLVMLLALLFIPRRRTTSSGPASRGFSVSACILGLLLFNYYLPPDHWLRAHNIITISVLSIILLWSSSSKRLFLNMALLFAFIFMPSFHSSDVLSQKRNFYGIKQVFSQAGAHVLLSQSTIHGFQVLTDENPTDGARAYYGSVYPVVQHLQAEHQPLRAMVLGLGTGIMACQFREQDKLTMVEIDEQVIAIAGNPTLFTYLRDCPPQTALIKDDGLLAATKVADASYELLVMDAFNSDAIPVHLLTLEAFTLYKQKITQDGVILVNISNRHLHVLPVLTGAGRELEMIVLHKSQAANHPLGQLPAEWALLTTNERLASNLLGEGWRFVADNNTRVWTNEYSNLIPLLKW